MTSTAALARARSRPHCLGRSPQRFAVVFGSNFLALPVHAGGALVVNLHAIHADVAFAGLGIARDHAGQRDEAAGVFGPALQDGEIQQREVVPLDDFLARAGRHRLGKKLAHFGQHGKHLYFVEKTLRRFHVHESADAVGHLVERVNFKRQIHAASRAELVDQNLRSGMALDVLEKQRRAAGSTAGDSHSLLTRSAISVISRTGSTSVRIVFSSPARSSAAIQPADHRRPKASPVLKRQLYGREQCRKLEAPEDSWVKSELYPHGVAGAKRHPEHVSS